VHSLQPALGSRLGALFKRKTGDPEELCGHSFSASSITAMNQQPERSR
jgi:hypothetical protein